MKEPKSITTMDLFNNTEQSPVQEAILHSSVCTSDLAKSDSNLNIQDRNNRTPLHYAIEHNNFEAVCRLLYYGADVNILCCRNFSPFTYALHLNRQGIARILYPYHDNFSLTNIYGYTVLHLAAWRRSPIANELVKADVNVNCVTKYGHSPVVFSLEYDDADLFKLMWTKCNYQTLLCSEKPFLLTYIQTWRFSVPEWVECINLILDSSGAFDLMNDSRTYLGENVHEYGFFWELLHSFYKIGVTCSDRMIIMYKCLSLGATVNIFDINLAIDLFGFAQELEALIYNLDWSLDDFVFDYHFIFPLPICIYGIENLDSEILTEILKKQISANCDSFKPAHLQRAIVNMLRFNSLSVYQKQEIITECQFCLKDFSEIRKNLDVIPEIPSLLELSRNKACDVIKQTFNVKKPYQFYDVVKMLNLPEHVKDIIQFRTPLY